MKKMPLQWKVFGFLIGFCLIMLVILWLFQSVFLETMYQAVRKRELADAISLVEQNLENPDLQEILTKLEQEQEIMVMQSNTFQTWERGKNAPFLVVSNARLDIAQTEEFVLSDGTNLSLTFYAIVSPVSATVSTLQYQLRIISGVLIVLSIFLAFLIARHVATPLQRLNQSAKQLALGDYDTHFAGTGFIEVAELSDTLNTAARELSQVEQMRRELLANISHDLRTPLALIYSYAEWMHDFPQEINTKHTDLIMGETKRLSSLVDDVLQLSKMESSPFEPQKKIYSLSKSAQGTMLRVGELVREDGYRITFCCSPAADEMLVCADETKITQAFYNLLLNAITHSGEDKLVNVTLTKEDNGQRILLSVEDHGAGIAAENLERIWERYYKVNHEHKRSITGSGLGLSIVKKIVIAHNGTYGAQSDGVGEGSRFYFSLPAIQPG